MDWNTLIGKKIFLRTKTKFYNGIVLEVNDVGNGLIFLLINDKFGMKVMFAISEILELKVEEEGNG